MFSRGTKDIVPPPLSSRAHNEQVMILSSMYRCCARAVLHLRTTTS